MELEWVTGSRTLHAYADRNTDLVLRKSMAH